MIKLNKCRTLYKFDQATLNTFLGQSQQNTETNPEENKEAKNNTETNNKSENLQEGGKASTDSKSAQNNTESQATNKTSEENKTENVTKDSSQNPESSDKTAQNASSTNYLFFEADEFIITTYQNESGWWAGYKDTGDGAAPQSLGYFPSNFVQVIEVYEVPTSNNFCEENFLK